MNIPKRIQTLFTQEMVEQIKNSITNTTLHNLSLQKKNSYNHHKRGYNYQDQGRNPSGLDFYKQVEWVIGDDIRAVRPEKGIIELFVGLDSEFTSQIIFEQPSEDDRFHADLSKRHYKGTKLFQELSPHERKQVEKENTTRNRGWKNIPISYQITAFSPHLDLLENHIFFLQKGDPIGFKELISRFVHIVAEKRNFQQIAQDIKAEAEANKIPKKAELDFSMISQISNKAEFLLGLKQKEEVKEQVKEEQKKKSLHPILRIYLVSHFSLAEMQTFSDFHDIKNMFDSIRGTFINMSSTFEFNTKVLQNKTFEKAFEKTFYKKNKTNKTNKTNKINPTGFDVELLLCDTMLLAPATHQFLNALGQVLNMPKILLPEGHSKERMHLFLKQEKQLFIKYAITDSIIALAYWVGIRVITQQEADNKLYQTVGSIAVALFRKHLKQLDISSRAFFGKNSSQFTTFYNLAISTFHGGRNESICVGQLKDDTFSDVDLAGAYSIAMAYMPQFDYDQITVCTTIEQLLDPRAHGIAEVEFAFPENTHFPCLPISNVKGLIYPLKGRSFATSYEIQVAQQLGCDMRLITGILLPPIDGERESPLKNFVRDIRAKRSKHDKGTLNNNFYKLVLNSLYGRFALGIKPKKYFNTRSGNYENSTPSSFSSPYYATLITGFVRAVLSEMASELSQNGVAVVSITTDGLIANSSIDRIKQIVQTPYVEHFKDLTEGIGVQRDDWLELKVTSNNLYSWKTRGQFALDHGKIKAMAGIQAPKGFSTEQEMHWFQTTFNKKGVKCLNKINRLSSLLEVYKGSPFGGVEFYKYISIQFDFKRKLVHNFFQGNTNENKIEWLTSVPWQDIKEMQRYNKLYIKNYPHKISDAESMLQFEKYIQDKDKRLKLERARKRKLARDFKVANVKIKSLRFCVRAALQGKAGFSRVYTAREVIDLLRRHGISGYILENNQKQRLKIDSNFCIGLHLHCIAPLCKCKHHF